MKQNHSLTILFVILTLILVALVSLHVRQLQQKNNTTPADTRETTAPEVAPPAEETILIQVTPENIAEIESRNLMSRPAIVPGALDAPVEIKQALQRQTISLLEESRAQPESEEDRRSLSLSEEEVLQLEKEGRMAY